MLTEQQSQAIIYRANNGDATVSLAGHACDLEVKTDADGEKYACVSIPKGMRNYLVMQDDGYDIDPTVVNPTHVIVYL